MENDLKIRGLEANLNKKTWLYKSTNLEKSKGIQLELGELIKAREGH